MSLSEPGKRPITLEPGYLVTSACFSLRFRFNLSLTDEAVTQSLRRATRKACP